MPKKRVLMRKIREVLRLTYEHKLSVRQVSKATAWAPPIGYGDGALASRSGQKISSNRRKLDTQVCA